MAAAATATQIPRNFTPGQIRRRSNATEKAMIPHRKIFPGVAILFPAALSCRPPPVRASKSEIEEVNDPDTAVTVKQQDDLSYLLKLGAGSFLGAAAIKYGSALFPEITTPNILQALIMISAPVILAVLLLIKKSSVE